MNPTANPPTTTHVLAIPTLRCAETRAHFGHQWQGTTPGNVIPVLYNCPGGPSEHCCCGAAGGAS